VTGSDRVEYVDNLVSNRVPWADGLACYALLCDPQGRIETDLYVLNAGEQLLLFVPPGRGKPTIDGWKAFIQDVDFEVATERFAVFGLHGPQATPTLATVLAGGPPPDDRLSFVRGEIADAGVSVLRTDAPVGEPGYDVVCTAESARDVLDALVNIGPSTPPFGRRVWSALTVESGTPLFETELEGRIPNVAGARAAVDFEKGCFVGQEVVSKVENVGRPSQRLVGLELERAVEDGAAVETDDSSVGEVTRAVESPITESPIAMAYVKFGVSPEATLTVSGKGEAVSATRTALPFVDGHERSGRLPVFE
jgi:aminomethyltransferase